MKACLMRMLALGIVAAMVFGTEGATRAADYPSKPVTVLVGFPPGAVADLSTRALTKAAEKFFSQPFVIVNKAGGGSVNATNELFGATPDGYTLGGILDSAFLIGPLLEKNLPYRGPRDFIPIIQYVSVKNAFVVRSDSPFKTMKEVIEYASANPGKLRIGHAGIGSATHISLESIIRAGIPLTHVPFRGGAPCITALLGGHIDGLLLNVMPPLPYVRAGKFRFLAQQSDERYTGIPELTDIPTFKELGYDVLTEGSQYFLSAPKGTPKEIVARLYDVFLKAQKTDLYQDFCRQNLITTSYKKSEELKAQLDKSFSFYKEFLAKIGLTGK